jgi:hypothetical protein
MDRRADRPELYFDRNLPQLLYSARAANAAVADKGDRLAVPLRVDPIDRVRTIGKIGATSCARRTWLWRSPSEY